MGPRLTGLTRDWMLEDIRKRFGLSTDHQSSSLTIGAELELIPVRADSGMAVPIESLTTTCSLDILRKVAAVKGWREVAADNDPPSWSLDGGARISFEPGGQIEISSAPHAGVSALIAELTGTCTVLADAFERHRVRLETKGADPVNPIRDVPLQLHRRRYEAMTQYFESIGPSGIRMMRQTASVQINVQPGREPLARWKLLNRLAPVLIAMFANSSRYEGEQTTHTSFRSHLWRTLDISRTGVMNDEDAIDQYCDFALDAGWMFNQFPEGDYRSFRESFGDATTREEWDVHLSTLFPEVRPKKFFEVRSPDVVESRWLAAPIGMVAGICYHDETALAVAELLEPCDDYTLVRAGTVGVHDPAIGVLAKEVAELAIRGCEALGPGYISADDLDTVRDFVDRYPANGTCPADYP